MRHAPPGYECPFCHLAEKLGEPGPASAVVLVERPAPIRIAKRIALAVLVASFSAAVAAMDFHPGAYPTLQLDEISQEDLLVKLKGYVEITGKLEAVWEAGEDGVPRYPNYSLVLDAASAAKMPTVDDYRVTSIDVFNGEEALRWLAGVDVADAFRRRKILRVAASGTFRLTQVGMGPACGQLHVAARIESITGVSQLALLKDPAPMSVC